MAPVFRMDRVLTMFAPIFMPVNQSTVRYDHTAGVISVKDISAKGLSAGAFFRESRFGE